MTLLRSTKVDSKKQGVGLSARLEGSMQARQGLCGSMVIVLVVVSLLLTGVAALAQESVEVKARVSGQILLNVLAGNSIDFDVDPLSRPEAGGQTELQVMTNAKQYSITASFGSFRIQGSGGYDLIAEGKFFIRSTAPGSGDGINQWTIPEGEMVVLEKEDGMTAGEVTIIAYRLVVDFTVPPGEGELEIQYTATASF